MQPSTHPGRVASAPAARFAGPQLGAGESTAWHWNVLVLLPYLAGLLVLAPALRGNLGFPLDDSWIHQVMARNLVLSHTWGFTPGVTSSGSSSTLWTLVLSLQYLFFPRSNPVLYPLLLNSLMLMACGLLLWRMARRDRLPLPQSLALAMLPGLSGNLDWLAFTGMEHVMFLVLSLLSILLWFRKGASPSIAVAAGLSLGALGLTRPEGLALLIGLLLIYRFCGRTLRDVLLAGITAAVLIAPNFLLNWKTSGALLPMTVRGRRYMYSGKETLHIGRSSFRGLMLDTYKDVIAHHFFHTSPGWFVAVFVALSFVGLLALLWRSPTRISVVCLWAVVDYVAYCVTLPEPGHGGRYQPFVLLLFPPLMAIGLMVAVRAGARWAVAKGSANALAWSSLLLAGALTAATLPRWKSALHDSIAEIDSTHVKLAEWINRNYPAQTAMAAFDIGAIGYFAHIHLVDLGGLVDRSYLPYLVARRVPDYLAERGVQYVILPHTGDDTHFGDLLNLLHNPALRLVPIHTEGGDPVVWNNGFDYTGNAHREQTLYRMELVPPSEQSPATTERNTRSAAGAREGSADGSR